jgi:hypothetical protein
MVAVLTNILTKFPGPANCAHCLAHIVNLVVQVILCQFDLWPKKKSSDHNLEHDNDDTDELEELSNNLDREENEMDNNGGDDDRVENDIGSIEDGMKEDVVQAAQHIKPVQHILIKVCSCVLCPYQLLIIDY